MKVELPFPSGSFDVGVSTQVYEYVPNISAALTELHRVLRPGGRAPILEPTGTPWSGTRKTEPGCGES